MPVGDELESCTKKVHHCIVPHPDHNRRIVFVDTPGFDDGQVNDNETWNHIIKFLANSKRKGAKFAGIIYLYDISQARFQPSQECLVMLNRLYGDAALRNVILATTKWDNVDPNRGSQRERQLRDNHWQRLLSNGSKMRQFTRTSESAWTIVNLLLGERPIDASPIQNVNGLRPAPRRRRRFFGFLFG